MISLKTLTDTICIHVKSELDAERLRQLCIAIGLGWFNHSQREITNWVIHKEDTIYYVRPEKMITYGDIKMYYSCRDNKPFYSIADIKELNVPILVNTKGLKVTISKNWKWEDQNKHSLTEIPIFGIIRKYERSGRLFPKECYVEWADGIRYFYNISKADYQLVYYYYIEDNEKEESVYVYIDPLELIKTLDNLIL